MAFDASEDIDEQESNLDNVVERMPDGDALENILKSIKETSYKSAEIRGLLKAEYDSAKDKGVNVKAIKIIAKIEAIDNEQDRDNLVSHLLTYLNKRGLSPQGDLFSDAPPQPPIGHNSQAMEAF